jgi:hypothetical protein
MSAACPAHLLVLEFEDSIPFLADRAGCALCNHLMAGIAGSNLADDVDVCVVGSGLRYELITCLEES